MTKGKVRDDRVEQLLAAVNSDGSVEVLGVRENVTIGLAITLADLQLHPDRYTPSTAELLHGLLALHAPQVEALRLKFGLQPSSPHEPGSSEEGD